MLPYTYLSNPKIQSSSFENDSNTIALFDFRKNQSYTTDLCGNTWTPISNSTDPIANTKFSKDGFSVLSGGAFYIDNSNIVNLVSNNTYTVEVFAKLDKVPLPIGCYGSFSFTDRNDGKFFEFGVEGNLKKTWFDYTSATRGTYGTIDTTNKDTVFHHLAITVNNKVVNMFFNGQKDTTTVTINNLAMFRLFAFNWSYGKVTPADQNYMHTAIATYASIRISNIVRYTQDFQNRVDLVNLRII